MIIVSFLNELSDCLAECVTTVCNELKEGKSVHIASRHIREKSTTFTLQSDNCREAITEQRGDNTPDCIIHISHSATVNEQVFVAELKSKSDLLKAIKQIQIGSKWLRALQQDRDLPRIKLRAVIFHDGGRQVTNLKKAVLRNSNKILDLNHNRISIEVVQYDNRGTGILPISN